MSLTKAQREVLRFSEGAYRILNDIPDAKRLPYNSVIPGVGRVNISYGRIENTTHGEVRKVTQTRLFTYENRRAACAINLPWNEARAYGEAGSLRIISTINTFDNVDTQIYLQGKKMIDVNRGINYLLNFLRDVRDNGFKNMDYEISFRNLLGIKSRHITRAVSDAYAPLNVSFSKTSEYKDSRVGCVKAVHGNVNYWTIMTTIRFDKHTEQLKGLVVSHIADLEEILGK